MEKIMTKMPVFPFFYWFFSLPISAPNVDPSNSIGANGIGRNVSRIFYGMQPSKEEPKNEESWPLKMRLDEVAFEDSDN